MQLWYHDNMDGSSSTDEARVPDRVQTGLRMDRSLNKVLKGLAEYLDMSLADLVEGMLLHALDGKVAITDARTLGTIEQLRAVYGLVLTAEDSHAHPQADE